MALILNLETATTNCSVGLARGGQLLALREDNSPKYSHAEQLHVLIGDVLKDAGVHVSELAAVGVSKGPGSYTGLRIGVSAAKGLCFSLDIPLIGHSTLRAMALQLRVEEGVLIPVLDARRMEVYSAVFSKDFSQLRETRAEIIDTSSFGEFKSEGTIHLLGSGAGKCKEILGSQGFEYYEGLLPSARDMSLATYEAYKAGTFEDTAYFEPFYLKDFIAGKPRPNQLHNPAG